jgi:hypothetical protein
MAKGRNAGELALAPKVAPAARAVAAQAILDRGNGKPMQRSEHSGPDGNPLMATAMIILTGMPEPDGEP